MPTELMEKAPPAPAAAVQAMRCTSCGKLVEAEQFWVEFPCPSCGKARVIRCEKCKGMENPYTCPSCAFKGP